MALEEFRRIADIKWDRLHGRIRPSVIRVKSGDVMGRRIRVVVTDEGVYQDLTGYTLSLVWQHKGNGTSGSDAFVPNDITRGDFELIFTTGMLSNFGNITASLFLVGGGSIYESYNFMIVNEQTNLDVGAMQSENSFSTLEQLIEYASGGGVIGEKLSTLDQTVAGIDRGYGGSYATLAAIQAAFPTGNTKRYIATNTGHWYYWNGSAWTDGGVFQATALPAGVKTMAEFIRLVKGAMSAVELVVNGRNFMATTGWTTFSSTQAVSGGLLVNTGTGSSYCGSSYYIGAEDATGTKYYYRYKMRVRSAGCTKIGIRSSGVTVPSTEIANPTVDVWYTKHGGFTKTAAAGSSTNVSLTQYYSSASGKIMEIEEVNAVNLTALYGAGFEPEPDDFGMLFDTWFIEHMNTAVDQTDLTTYEAVRDEVLWTKQTDDSLDYVFITDPHAIQSRYDSAILKLENAVRMANLGFVDFLVFGGDFICESGYSEDIALSRGKMLAIQGILRKSKVPVIVLHGNHDDNSINTTAHTPAQDFSRADFYKTFVKPFAIEGCVHDSQNPTSLYYYKDLADKKIRLIVLDGCDYPYILDGGNYRYRGADWFGYGARQTTWLGTEALVNIPAGFRIVVLSHLGVGSSYNNGTLIEGQLSACHAGSTYSGTNANADYGVSVNVNFTSQGARPILSFQCGHNHVDSVSLRAGGWNVVVTNDCISSEVIDVTTVDGATSKTYFTRFGAGADREITY